VIRTEVRKGRIDSGPFYFFVSRRDVAQVMHGSGKTEQRASKMRYIFTLAATLAAAIPLGGCIRASPGDMAQLTPRSELARRAASAPQPASEPTPTASRLLPPPEALTDPVITAKVKASLVTDPAMTGADVSVNTNQGVVSLTGLVASQEQAAVASAHAQREDGVMRVDNHLAVNLR
jgi:hypothetical protein